MGKLALWSGVAGAAGGAQKAVQLGIQERWRKQDEAREERLLKLRQDHDKGMQDDRQEHSTGEREAGQEYGTGERIDAQEHAAGESALQRQNAMGIAQAQIGSAEGAPERAAQAQLKYDRTTLKEFGFVKGMPDTTRARLGIGFAEKDVVDPEKGIKTVQTMTIRELGTNFDYDGKVYIPEGTSPEAQEKGQTTLDSPADPNNIYAGKTHAEAAYQHIIKLRTLQERTEFVSEIMEVYGVIPGKVMRAYTGSG